MTASSTKSATVQPSNAANTPSFMRKSLLIFTAVRSGGGSVVVLLMVRKSQEKKKIKGGLTTVT